MRTVRTVRSARVGVFPYRIVYYVTDTSIVILAYAHQRRQPDYWQHRLERRGQPWVSPNVEPPDEG